MVTTDDDDELAKIDAEGVKSHQVNKASFEDPNAQAALADLHNRRTMADNKVAPTIAKTTVAPTTRAEMQQARPSERVQGANLGPAVTSGPSRVDQGVANEARQYQAGVMSDLAADAGGTGVAQDLARAAYEKAGEDNFKRMLSLNAMRGRGPSNSLATVLDATGADRQVAAGNFAADSMGAALDARKTLIDAAGQTRQQDLGVATSDAGFQDSADTRNQAAQNTFGLEQFKAANDIAINNATRGDMNSQFNADLASRLGIANMTEANKMKALQAQITSEEGKANLESQLRTMGLSSEEARAYTAAMLQKEQQDREAGIAYEELAAQNAQAENSMALKANEGDADRETSIWGDIIGAAGTAVGAVAGASDIRLKKNVHPLAAYDFEDDGGIIPGGK